jgi:hypothetical protein
MQLHTISDRNASCHLGYGSFQHLPQQAQIYAHYDHRPFQKLGKVHTKMLHRLQKVMNTYDFESSTKKEVKCQPITSLATSSMPSRGMLRHYSWLTCSETFSA